MAHLLTIIVCLLLVICLLLFVALVLTGLVAWQRQAPHIPHAPTPSDGDSDSDSGEFPRPYRPA